jgi:hypothetical protein
MQIYVLILFTNIFIYIFIARCFSPAGENTSYHFIVLFIMQISCITLLPIFIHLVLTVRWFLPGKWVNPYSFFYQVLFIMCKIYVLIFIFTNIHLYI